MKGGRMIERMTEAEIAELNVRRINRDGTAEVLCTKAFYEITALRAEVSNLKGVARHHKERAETLCAENARLTARIRELEGALAMGIYEATHLSPQEPDGSHWAKISSDFLATARAALEEKQ